MPRCRSTLLSALLAALTLAACDPAADAGRRGNAALADGRPAEALAAYGAGLSESDTARHDLRARLLGNSALAQIARDSSASALLAADLAAVTADDADLRRGAFYHGGIAAAGSGITDDALRRFRAALLLDGAFEDAAYNWEAVARQRARSGGEGGGGDTPRDDSGESKSDGDDGEGDDKPGDQTPDPPSDNGGRRPGDDPSETPSEANPEPWDSPPTITQGEADRLLDAVGRDEARLMRRTVRGSASPARRTRDW